MRVLALVLAVLLAHAVQAQDVNDRQATESDVLLLQLVVDGSPVSEVLNAYQSDRDVLLPLGEMARVLTLAINVQPERGTASGYILREERVFGLDLSQSTVVVEGIRKAVNLRAVQQRSDDIYVPSRLLAQWLPIDIDVEMSSLSLVVSTRERLPMQYRLERLAQAELLGKRTPAIAAQYPRYDIPYKLLAWPVVDQTLSMEYLRSDGQQKTVGRYSAYAAADVLRMQGEMYFSASAGGEAADVRWTLGRNDPDAGLLGPLRARTASFGNISIPAVRNVSRTNMQGLGVLISNRALAQPDSFSQHSLAGPLPPGWDVELYFNDVLVGFQSARPDGQYRFDDQPLLFGSNEFRLVFHGPLGQVRVERESFLLDRSATAAGEFHYSLAQQHDDHGSERTVASFDWGLSDHLTATGGFVRTPVAGVHQDLLRAGVQSYWRKWLLSGELVKSQGGSLLEMEVRTRIGGWSLNASQARLQGFSSEIYLPSGDAVSSRSGLRVDGALTFPAGNFRLPITLEVNRQLRESGASTLEMSGRISARARGTLASAQFRRTLAVGQVRSDAVLQLSRSVAGVSLRGEAGYLLQPQSRLSTIAVSADRRLGNGYIQTAAVTRSFDSRETLFSTGFTKAIGSFGLGFNAGYSSRNNVSASLQFNLAMGRGARGAGWQFDAQPLANSGGVSAQVFLDENMNGRRDAGETPIEGVSFTVNGGRSPNKTDANGVVYLARLPALQRTDIAVVTESLEDPHWLPQLNGLQLVPRPGMIATLDIAVLRTSEVEGTVYLLENSRRRELGSMLIEVVDPHGRVVATGTTGADGYYVAAGVPAGDFSVRVAATQLRELGLQETSAHAINVARDGWLVSDVDFELQRAPNP